MYIYIYIQYVCVCGKVKVMFQTTNQKMVTGSFLEPNSPNFDMSIAPTPVVKHATPESRGLRSKLPSTADVFIHLATSTEGR